MEHTSKGTDTANPSTGSTDVKTEVRTKSGYTPIQENDIPGTVESLRPRLVTYGEINALSKAKRRNESKPETQAPVSRYLAGFDDTKTVASFFESVGSEVMGYTSLAGAVKRKSAWAVPTLNSIVMWFTPEALGNHWGLDDMLAAQIMWLARSKKSSKRVQEYKIALAEMTREVCRPGERPHVVISPRKFKMEGAHDDMLTMIAEKADMENRSVFGIHYGDDIYNSHGFVKHKVVTLGAEDETWKEDPPKFTVTLRKPKVDVKST